MSNRLTMNCASCAQQLVVDAASAGKKIRCPKCQSISTVPISNVATPTLAMTPATRVVGCPQCKTRISVPVRETALVAKCPNCKTSIQVSANATVKPTTQVTPPTHPNKSPVVPRPAATTRTSGEQTVDLGQFSLPPVTNSSFGPSPLASPANSPLSSRNTGPKLKSGSPFLAWVNDHRWVAVIVALNLLSLLGCIFFPPLLVIVLVGLPMALVIVGLLFVPRQHIIKRVVGATGAQMVSAGGGGLLLVLAISAKAILRAMRRGQDNPNLDMGNIGEVIVVVGGIALFGVVFVVLWRFIGIARVMAAGYCSLMALLMLLGLVGGATRGTAKWATRDGNAMPEGMKPPQFDTDDFFQRSRADHDAFMARMEADRKRQLAAWEASMKGALNGNANPTYTPPPAIPHAGPEMNHPGVTLTQIKRYPIALPLPAGARQVDAGMQFVPGIKLRACYAGSWCQVTIVRVNDDGTLRMNWDDYPAFTYDMLREDMIIDSNTLESLAH